MGKLDGKVALITGAGSGIGRATAILFAKEGARVAVADYVPAGGKETVKIIKKAGNNAIFIEADVSKAADVQKMIKKTVDTYGRLDILHNNAGIEGPIGPVESLSEEDWDRIIDINLKGVFLGSKYAIPVMLAQGGGVIINTASVAGMIGLGDFPAYCATKGGIIQLTRATAVKCSAQNIRINCICPGTVDTPLIEPNIPTEPAAREAFMKTLIRPEEIARVALYLACDDSSSVIGAAVVVDRGALAGM